MRKKSIAAALLFRRVDGRTAPAQVSNDVVKLGVTNDQASIYSAAGGFGSVIAARMAAEDFGGTVLGKKIEVVFADNQNKPDIGVSIVRRWLDTENVDVDRRRRQLGGRHGDAAGDARQATSCS